MPLWFTLNWENNQILRNNLIGYSNALKGAVSENMQSV